MHADYDLRFNHVRITASEPPMPQSLNVVAPVQRPRTAVIHEAVPFRVCGATAAKRLSFGYLRK